MASNFPPSYAVTNANNLSVDTHLDLMRAIGEVQTAPVIAGTDRHGLRERGQRYAAVGVAAVGNGG